jgi:Papain family cysteine protease
LSSCTVGDPFGALFNIIDKGVSEESVYPYTGKKAKCQSATKPPTYFVPNVAYAQMAGDDTVLKYMLVRHGPVVVGIGEKFLFF